MLAIHDGLEQYMTISSLGSRIFLASSILLMLIEPGMCLALNAHSPNAFTSLNLSLRSNFCFNCFSVNEVH